MEHKKIKKEDNVYYVNVAKVIYTTILIDADQVSEDEILNYSQNKLEDFWIEGDSFNEYYDII